MSDPLMDARGEAVQEVTTAMLLAAGNALMRHGNDPMAEVILGAAIAMFIQKVDGTLLASGFKKRMLALLANG